MKKEQIPQNVLQDIAGVRIVCYFTGDIHNLVNILKKQPDLIFIRERDYIENPKPNGYRSYHIIFGVNVCCLDAFLLLWRVWRAGLYRSGLSRAGRCFSDCREKI